MENTGPINLFLRSLLGFPKLLLEVIKQLSDNSCSNLYDRTVTSSSGRPIPVHAKFEISNIKI